MTSPKPAVQIVVANEAVEAELYAARQLQKYICDLHGHVVPLVSVKMMDAGQSAIVIGSAGQDVPACRCHFPKSSSHADGFVLQTVQSGPDVLMIAGNCPRGTLFGVYELVERWGVVFTLTEDLMPKTPAPFSIAELNDRCEPAYAIRALRPMANVPEGSAPWSLSDFTGFIDQMAKLKYNTFAFIVQESGPWLDYSFRGVERPAGDIFYGYRYPIDENFVGREHFGGQRAFYNPVLAAASNDSERKRLGVGLLKDIIAHCKSRGLMTILIFSMLEPPTEFKHRFNDWASLPLPDPATFANAAFNALPTEELGTNPKYAAWMNVLDPVVRELAAVRIQALINTYPQADQYHLWVSEHRTGVVDTQKIFDELDARYRLTPDFDWRRALAEYRTSPYDAERYQHQMKGDLLFLYALDKMFNEDRLLAGTVKPDASIAIVGVMPQLAPVLMKMLPKNFTMGQFPDYGSHGVADRIDQMTTVLGKGVSATLEVGIHDDNTMYFPQANVQSLQKIVHATASCSMRGYVAALWQVRQSDVSAAYLGRASWRPHLTASQFYRDFFPRYVGDAAADQFEKVYRLLEQADRFIRSGLLYGYAFLLTSSIIRAFIETGVDRPAVDRLRADYVTVLDILTQTDREGDSAAAAHLNFWTLRVQFAIEWLDFAVACESFGKLSRSSISSSGIADRLASLDNLIKRSESLIERIASDVRHPGDLGQIVSLNRHMRSFLLEQRAQLQAEEKPREN